MNPVSSRLKTALEAAGLAGKFLLRARLKLKPRDIETKSKNNYVTWVDREAETLIRGLIRRRHPSDAVLGEEDGETGAGPVRWIIDPLDGTSNYIRRIPFYGTSIAVAFDGKVKAGVVCVPVRGETFWAVEKKGARLNGSRIRVSKRERPDVSLVGTAIPYKSLRKRWAEYDSILRKIARAGADTRRSGAMAVDLAYVACGRLDALWGFDQAPWDLAAGELLVREAGGVTSALRPGSIGRESDRLCGNPLLHGRLLSLIGRSRPKPNA